MTSPRHAADLPLVYSCSGCSSAAQMVNYLALSLDRTGAAEMSCIAGVGGGIEPLLRLARSGRPILALDGCPLVCVKESLAQYGIEPQAHVVLSDYGVKKRRHADFDLDEANRLLPEMEGRALMLRQQREQPRWPLEMAAQASLHPQKAASGL